MNIILAVDKDLNVYGQQAAEWTKISISITRADTMHEAIIRLTHGDEFLFIAINEDSIPDFGVQLPIMRDVTNLPIFVITSSYSNQKKTRAIGLGADVYDPFNRFVKDNVLGALESLKLQNKWSKRPSEPLPLLVGGEVILSPSRQCVFVKDVEISLTKKEFCVLEYLMTNKNQYLTFIQILRKVWGSEFEDATHDLIWNTIKRLREKLKVSNDSLDYIESKREVGYRFHIT